MRKNFRTLLPALSLFVATIVAAMPSAARAESIIDPTAVSTNMGSLGGSYLPINMINQSGLSQNYTSGVTDFASYTATTKANNTAGNNPYWESAFTTTGEVTFTLGGPVAIDQMAFWNVGNAAGIVNFTLLASNDPTFATYTTLGSFVASQPAVNSSVSAQVFSFATTTATYVEMEINSVNGGGAAAISEVAFASVPEPSSLAMCGLAGLIGGGYAWRRRRRAAIV